MRVLFVTWDGPQLTYLQGLFLPIFAGLRQHGHQFSVLQFTWGDHARSDSAKAACEAVGVPYRRVDVWRAGAAGAFLTAAFGGRHVDQAVHDWAIDALMPRSLMPALSVLRSRSGRRLPILFDADGLPADERVEFGGLNPAGLIYRILRAIESHAIRRARVVLVRTEATIPILAARGRRGTAADRFHVVTNGRQPAPYLAARIPEDHGPGPRLCYLGSIGPQYLPERMFELAAHIRSNFPETTLSVFTRDAGTATSAMISAGIAGEPWIDLQSIEPDEVPQALAGCDIGFALRQPSLSMQAVAPIKIGDYLLAGVPIIGSEGVGPVAEAIQSELMMPADRPPEKISAWIGEVMADRRKFRERCRQLGVKEFSIARSISQYHKALAASVNRPPQS